MGIGEDDWCVLCNMGMSYLVVIFGFYVGLVGVFVGWFVLMFWCCVCWCGWVVMFVLLVLYVVVFVVLVVVVGYVVFVGFNVLV